MEDSDTSIKNYAIFCQILDILLVTSPITFKTGDVEDELLPQIDRILE